jgi:uncharacterized RDD family membrane protein YckC
MAEIEKLDTLQAIELAEGVEIRLRMAGPVLRISAYAMDFVIRLLILIAGMVAFLFAGIAVGNKVAQGMILVTWFLLDWLYPVFFEAGKRGATPGKRIMGLRVVQTTGSPITIGQSVVRNFLRFMDGMPLFFYVFGITCCLATKRFQRLGDLAAGTVVIYDRLPPLKFTAHPASVTPLPIPLGLSADETRALGLFRERADLWSEARRVEIADQASALTGANGAAGVQRLLGMACWVQEKRGGR